MDHAAKAEALFCEGYNCAQAVLGAFSDVIGMDTQTAMRLASPFGGGMGRMREVCGAVSGALMVLGLVLGYDDPTAAAAKKELYARVQEAAAQFRQENGSIICRELLAGVTSDTSPVPDARTAEYYKKRPCVEMVKSAARIAEEMLNAYSHP